MAYCVALRSRDAGPLLDLDPGANPGANLSADPAGAGARRCLSPRSVPAGCRAHALGQMYDGAQKHDWALNDDWALNHDWARKRGRPSASLCVACEIAVPAPPVAPPLAVPSPTADRQE